MAEPPPWLGLERTGTGRWSFTLVNELARLDAKFYGGTGLAVAVALLEAETGRDALYATVQFVSGADLGDRIDCDVEKLADGRRTSQLRVTGYVGERVMFAALGAAGAPRAGGLTHQVREMPDVPPPDASLVWAPRAPFAIEVGKRGWLDMADVREVPDVASGMALWARMRDHGMTRPALGFLADMVPSAVVRATGRAGAGTSLDNAIRLGPAPRSEWVLVEFDPHFASDGYVHGAAHLWDQDGTHLAVASQTAVSLLFD
jgi:acyl-CoA thioesterase